MQEINNYIKENDTDNVTLKKLKELGTKLTGQENVQGETIADVLDFINSNYSGGGSGSKTILYLKESEFESTLYAYKDEDCTTKADMNELYNVYEKGCIFKIQNMAFSPISFGKYTEDGIDFCEVIIYIKNMNTYREIMSSEFVVA